MFYSKDLELIGNTVSLFQCSWKDIMKTYYDNKTLTLIRITNINFVVGEIVLKMASKRDYLF